MNVNNVKSKIQRGKIHGCWAIVMAIVFDIVAVIMFYFYASMHTYEVASFHDQPLRMWPLSIDATHTLSAVSSFFGIALSIVSIAFGVRILGPIVLAASLLVWCMCGVTF